MHNMDPCLPPLIEALLESQRYPHSVAQVELVQTHISWVLLAGDFAYKIKKPVRLPFLDFSTLAQRQHYCREELRLNRRFAPDLYLDVLPIFNTPQQPQWTGAGAAIEYAVKMRRFDEAARLDRVCQRGELQAAHLSDLADTLHAFHAGAAVSPGASHFGSPQQVLAPTLDNFDELRRMQEPGLARRLAVLRAWTEAQHQQLTPLLQARKRGGWVRECHGDLHLANMVLIEQRVRLFDCIEFNEDMRWIDVACEAAFTYVDLLAHQRPGLANWFVNEVFSLSGDYEAAPLLRFYAVYLALVRAKVGAIRAAQTQGDAGEALRYIALAERLTAPPAARLIITHGLSGCGKTVVSSQLLQSGRQACTLRLRSDVERKRLFGRVSSARSGAGMNTGIYSAEASARTYSLLRQRAARLLRAGWSVVVDAAFLRQAERADFQALADELGVAFAILAPQANPEQLRQRIEARAALGQDASEATLAVLAQQRDLVEPLTPQEVAQLYGDPITDPARA